MSDTDPAPKKRNVFVRVWRWLTSRPSALWRRIHPNPRTLRAISVSTFLATMALGAYAGHRTNLTADIRVLLGHEGPPLVGSTKMWLDVGGGAIAAALMGMVAWWLFLLVGRIGRWLPTAVGRAGLGALLTLIYLFGEMVGGGPPALVGALLVVLLVGGTFGGIAAWRGERFSDKGWFGKTAVWGFVALGVFGSGALVFGALHEGSTKHLTKFPEYAAESEPAALTGTDPGRPGEYAGKIGYLTYGSGTDVHRPEFGAEVTIKTETVNGKPFAELPKGHSGKKRELFWQFPLSAMPLNGRVWYPKGDGPFPLVLIVHGNHSMREFSDTGYEYLGEHLASHGYILCSVDQNFINGGMRKENDARGWLLLEHLKVWQRLHAETGGVFLGKVDFERIALMGHSRGGEAVTHAAVFNRLKHYPDDASVTFDYDFNIKSIVSIAPVDGQYKPAGRYAPVRDINYLTLHGSHDADVTQFQGDRIFNRLKLRKGSDQFKASVYAYRANHGQFNTVWGATDHGPPRSLLLNTKALLDGEEQRLIGKVYITAFLEATLRGQRSYLPMFGNARAARDWLPDAHIITRYEDASFDVIADFEEDVDVTTTTVEGGSIEAKGLVVFRENDIKLRSSSRSGGGLRFNHGAFLGWSGVAEEGDKSKEGEEPAEPLPEPTYEITLPDGYLAGQDGLADKQLVLHLAQVDEKPKAKDYSPDEPKKNGDAEESEGDDEPDEEDDGEEEDDEDDDGEEDDEDDDKAKPMLSVSVALLTADGPVSLPLATYGRLLPPLTAVTSRATFLGRQSPKTEITLQVFALPLADFVAAKQDLDLKSVTGIRLSFERAQPGVVVLDRVGLAEPPK